MKIVKFENGKYGIRMYWAFGWHFLDLVDPRYKWERGDRHFPDCQTDDLKLCKTRMVEISKPSKQKYTIYKE